MKIIGINTIFIVLVTFMMNLQNSIAQSVDTLPVDEAAETILWDGEKVVSWHKDNYSRLNLPAELFKDIDNLSEMTLRIGITGYRYNSKIALMTPEEEYSAATPITRLYKSIGRFYETSLSDSFSEIIKKKGLTIIGEYLTITRISVLAKKNLPDITASLNPSCVKIWGKNETPYSEVSITNNTKDKVKISVHTFISSEFTTDWQDIRKEVVLLPKESKTVKTSFKVESGFHLMTIEAGGKRICAYTIGYDPENEKCPGIENSEFDGYWSNCLKQLNDVSPEFKMRKVEELSTNNRNVYVVSMKSVPDYTGGEPITIKGYYAEPIKSGVYPTVIHYQGSDFGKSPLNNIHGDDNPGWCELLMSTRGQQLNRFEPEPNFPAMPYGSNFYGYEWGNKDRYYYKLAYLDCVRAVDFVFSRNKVRKDCVFAEGGSQGGCFTYVTAGLDRRICGIAPAITGHSDFPHTMMSVSWPTGIFEQGKRDFKWTDQQMHEFNDLFDTKNFAQRVECPVLSYTSLQDTIDIPHINFAAYNSCSKTPNKHYVYDSFLDHRTPSWWTDEYMNFFQTLIEEANSVNTPYIDNANHCDDNSIYDLTGRKLNDIPPHGFYVKNGKKHFVLVRKP